MTRSEGTYKALYEEQYLINQLEVDWRVWWCWYTEQPVERVEYNDRQQSNGLFVMARCEMSNVVAKKDTVSPPM